MSRAGKTVNDPLPGLVQRCIKEIYDEMREHDLSWEGYYQEENSEATDLHAIVDSIITEELLHTQYNSRDRVYDRRMFQEFCFFHGNEAIDEIEAVFGRDVEWPNGIILAGAYQLLKNAVCEHYELVMEEIEEESEEEQEEQAVYESSAITTEDGTVHTYQFRVFDSE